VLLTVEYVIGAAPSAVANDDGVNGDCTVVMAVVGSHVTVCALFAWPMTVAEPDA
jgi:hypothetical protein